MQKQERYRLHISATEGRADPRSSADFRSLALQEELLAEAADLPRVREKHRMAARSWIALARALERSERLGGGAGIALAS
jgi:hypothetical protein